MIRINDEIVKVQPNFWNQCVFHPTDAVEDPWGKRILDQMADDDAIDTIRIYSMFEDIVYLSSDGELLFDFRLSDLRIDYLLEKGYNLLIAYAGIPDCIASSTTAKTSVSKNKTRYKGKMWNSSPVRDYALWEEVCYRYTKHLVERYGIDRVSKWRCHCLNEPDIPEFFFSNLAREDMQPRIDAYCKTYEAFQRAIRRVSEKIQIGGPALAVNYEFLKGFLDYISANNLKLDFVSVHKYSTSPREINAKTKPISVTAMTDHYFTVRKIMAERGFIDTPVLFDEWGMSSCGFFNREECPDLTCRETEVFSAFFVKMIHRFISLDCKLESLMICLSGQHEMTEDFSGFRNFFSLNFIKKPIYNAHILASKLYQNLLSYKCENENVAVIPTKSEDGKISVLLTYADDNCTENIAPIQQKLSFDGDISSKTITVWCIDKTHCNPYRLFQSWNEDVPNDDQLSLLCRESNLKPVTIKSNDEPITLSLTPNCTYLVTVD